VVPSTSIRLIAGSITLTQRFANCGAKLIATKTTLDRGNGLRIEKNCCGYTAVYSSPGLGVASSLAIVMLGRPNRSE
jgi:hypothetical protein